MDPIGLGLKFLTTEQAAANKKRDEERKKWKQDLKKRKAAEEAGGSDTKKAKQEVTVAAKSAKLREDFQKFMKKLHSHKVKVEGEDEMMDIPTMLALPRFQKLREYQQEKAAMEKDEAKYADIYDESGEMIQMRDPITIEALQNALAYGAQDLVSSIFAPGTAGSLGKPVLDKLFHEAPELAGGQSQGMGKREAMFWNNAFQQKNRTVLLRAELEIATAELGIERRVRERVEAALAEKSEELRLNKRQATTTDGDNDSDGDMESDTDEPASKKAAAQKNKQTGKQTAVVPEAEAGETEADESDVENALGKSENEEDEEPEEDDEEEKAPPSPPKSRMPRPKAAPKAKKPRANAAPKSKKATVTEAAKPKSKAATKKDSGKQNMESQLKSALKSAATSKGGKGKKVAVASQEADDAEFV